MTTWERRFSAFVRKGFEQHFLRQPNMFWFFLCDPGKYMHPPLFGGGRIRVFKCSAEVTHVQFQIGIQRSGPHSRWIGLTLSSWAYSKYNREPKALTVAYVMIRRVSRVRGLYAKRRDNSAVETEVGSGKTPLPSSYRSGLLFNCWARPLPQNGETGVQNDH